MASHVGPAPARMTFYYLINTMMSYPSLLRRENKVRRRTLTNFAPHCCSLKSCLPSATHPGALGRWAPVCVFRTKAWNLLGYRRNKELMLPPYSRTRSIIETNVELIRLACRTKILSLRNNRSICVGGWIAVNADKECDAPCPDFS
jgi:hypothetical protein